MQISAIRFFAGMLCVIFLIIPGYSLADDVFSRNLLIALNSSNNLRDRVVAMRYLGGSGDERAVKPLLSVFVNDREQEGIRCNAARELADLGKDRSEIISTFEKVYKEQGTENNLKYTILFSLGQMRAKGSLSFLSDALSDPRAMIRFKASQAMGQLRTVESVEILISHLKNEQDRMVRAEIVRALDGVENPNVEKALIHSLVSDPAPLVRWNAALTLKKFKTLSPDARIALGAALNDSSEMVRKTVKGMVR